MTAGFQTVLTLNARAACSFAAGFPKIIPSSSRLTRGSPASERQWEKDARIESTGVRFKSVLPTVMPAKAGIHDFLSFGSTVKYRKNQRKKVVDTRFAGMTGEAAVRVQAPPGHPEPAYVKGYRRPSKIKPYTSGLDPAIHGAAAESAEHGPPGQAHCCPV